jgi:SAM-dependent methyltransferase
MRLKKDYSPPVMPAAEPSGFIPTLNQQGYALATLDEYTQAFVDFAATCSQPVVDVGAAYGLTSLPALKAGARVIALDLDRRHLDILREQVPLEYITNLTTLAAEFPERLPVPSASVGAFMLARVAHFFTPKRFQLAVEKMHEWLVPEGKVFLTAETPYLKNWEAFRPVYDQRRKMGETWPGFIEGVSRYASSRSVNLPPSMMLFDKDVLERVFTQAGFVVEKLEYLPRPNFPADLRLDGRESVGLIARKPAPPEAP